MRPNLTTLFVGAALLFGIATTTRGKNPSRPAPWLAGYVAIDTSNPPGNEQAAVAYLRQILHKEGLQTRVFVSPSGRPSLYARIDGDSATARSAVVLLHHMDVVPPGPGWTVDPFKEPLRDGRIWGRGAIDDKSLGIAHLTAFLDLARSRASLRHSVVFLAVADEEAGGAEGTGWLLEHHPDLFEDTIAVLGEGGVNRVHAGKIHWWGIEVSQKRPLWLEARSWGRGGHGSMLNLGSAPHQLTKALARLLDRPLEYRISPPVRQYLERVAPYQSSVFQEMVGSLDEIVTRPEPHRDLFPGIPNYLLDSIQINVINAGERINVVPASASALIDIRLLPDTDRDEFLRSVQDALGSDIEVDVLLDAPEAPPSSTENEFFRCVADHLSGSAPVVPSFIPGITDSRYFRQRGIDAYGFSPFLFEPTEAAGVHSKNESISLETFERGVQTMRRVLRACVAN